MWRLGGIVPWIGFREVEIPCEEARAWGLTQSALGKDFNHVRVDSFEVEWLGFGCMLAVRAIQPPPPL